MYLCIVQVKKFYFIFSFIILFLFLFYFLIFILLIILGGIRCEKASAYVKNKGICENVVM